MNRRGTQIKVLYFDRSGFCVWAKRLEAGKFISKWEGRATRELDYTGLKLLLEGVQVSGYRKRYGGADRTTRPSVSRGAVNV